MKNKYLKFSKAKQILFLFFLILVLSLCKPKQENTLTQFAGKPEVPSSIKAENQYLLDKVKPLTLYPDSTGIAALKLNELMQHHFKEEEDYVLPPLGLLPSLAAGALPEQRKEVIALTAKLKLQLPHMSAEHQLIKAYLNELVQAAAKDNHPEVIEFEKEVHKHAITEEEVLFPAALLIGEYLELKIPADGN
jgi:hypothetical protein